MSKFKFIFYRFLPAVLLFNFLNICSLYGFDILKQKKRSVLVSERAANSSTAHVLFPREANSSASENEVKSSSESTIEKEEGRENNCRLFCYLFSALRRFIVQ